MRRLAYILILWLTAAGVQAQGDRQLIREGNKLYRDGQYAKAETAYRKAMAQNPHNAHAVYNLGCALMKQKNDSLAVLQFGQAAQMETDKARRAMAYHNMGVVLQQKQNYGDAIEAYKNALRNNPNDNDTRYNLALCKRQQQQQQQNQQGKSDPQKQDNDQKDKQKDPKDDQKKDKQQPDKDEQKQEPKEQMSKQNAEQLLNAALQQEKQTQERLKKAMQQPRRRNLDKNW